jgi:hypothetical protein
MKLVQYFSDGTLAFNWDQLPENISSNIELRDKIFKELQLKLEPHLEINQRLLFDANKFVIDRIKSELKLKK